MADRALTYQVEMNLAQARNEARQLSGIYQQELARVDLRVLDTGLNQATGEARQLQSNLRGVTDEIERAGRASRNITSGGAAAGGGGLGGLATGLIGGLTGYLATQGAQQIAQQAEGFAELGTQARRADEAFTILSGGARNAEQRIKAIQAASGDAVTELKAMEIGTQLVSLRLAKTTDDFERLTRAGREIVLVSPTIKDLGEALTQLSLFAANEQSFARADQLGLSASEVRDRMKELQAANEDLDGSQAKLLASTQLLEEKFGAVLDSGSAAASGVEKFKVALEDARNEIAKGPIGRGVDSLFGLAGGAISGVAGQTNQAAINWSVLLGTAELEDSVQRIQTLLNPEGFSARLEQVTRAAVGNSVNSDDLVKVLSTVNQFNNALDRGVPGLEDYRDVLAAIAQEAAKTGGVTDSQAKALDAIAVSVAQASNAYRDLQASQTDTSAIDNLLETFRQLDLLIAQTSEFSPDQLPGIDQIQQQLIDLKSEIAATGQATDEQLATMSRLEDLLHDAGSAVEFMSNAENRAAVESGNFNAALASMPGYLEAVRFHAYEAADALDAAIDAQNRLKGGLSSGLAGLVSQGILTAQEAQQVFNEQQAIARQQAAQIAALPADQRQFAQAQAQYIVDAPVRDIKEQDRLAKEAIREQEAAQKKAAREAESAFKKAASETEKEWKKQAQQLESDIRSTPGLFGTSSVTQEQIDAAKNGVPQNFADNWLRRLKDEVTNGKDWQGVSIDQAKEALARVGIVASDNAETVVQQITDAWNNSVLFSDPANLALIDEEAVRANQELQEKSRQGQANILKHFGVVVDEAVAAATGGGAAGGVTPTPGIGPLPQLPTGDQAALAGGAAGTFALNVSPTTMADVTSALIEQAAEEQPRMEALGSLYGLYFGNGLAGRDYAPTTESIVSSMAGALATQGDVIKGQGEDYASIMALGIAGYDFTNAAASAVIGLRSAFGTEENLNILLGTGGAVATFVRDGMLNEVNKPDWAQSFVDSIVSQILASAAEGLAGQG